MMSGERDHQVANFICWYVAYIRLQLLRMGACNDSLTHARSDAQQLILPCAWPYIGLDWIFAPSSVTKNVDVISKCIDEGCRILWNAPYPITACHRPASISTVYFTARLRVGSVKRVQWTKGIWCKIAPVIMLSQSKYNLFIISRDAPQQNHTCQYSTTGGENHYFLVLSCR